MKIHEHSNEKYWKSWRKQWEIKQKWKQFFEAGDARLQRLSLLHTSAFGDGQQAQQVFHHFSPRLSPIEPYWAQLNPIWAPLSPIEPHWAPLSTIEPHWAQLILIWAFEPHWASLSFSIVLSCFFFASGDWNFDLTRVLINMWQLGTFWVPPKVLQWAPLNMISGLGSSPLSVVSCHQTIEPEIRACLNESLRWLKADSNVYFVLLPPANMARHCSTKSKFVKSHSQDFPRMMHSLVTTQWCVATSVSKARVNLFPGFSFTNFSKSMMAVAILWNIRLASFRSSVLSKKVMT